MTSALLALFLAVASSGRAAAPPAPALKHRFYIGPEEIRALDTRTLAKLLVDRIHRECGLAGAPSSGEKILGDDSDLIVMVPARVLDSIAGFGFLNQHQTLTSGGQHRELDRFETEQELAMLRLPFGEKGRELLPKYAVLDAKKEGLGTFRLPTQYGGVAVVFKKEVGERATWTYADSLDYSRKTGRFDRGGAANPVLARTLLDEKKKEDRNRCGNYCEAQIWGGLSLSDARYVMIRGSEPIPGAISRAGLPVYDYAVPESTSAVVDATRTAQYVRGAQRAAASAPAARDRLARAVPNDEALAAAVESASSEPGEDGAFAPRERLIGELAARAKSPVVVRELEKVFASGGAQAKALALYGLSELPWSDFKPRLIEALSAAKGPLLISAVAFSAEHRDDADVAARLQALKRGPESDASEWLERFDKTRLCEGR
jgi:hypothetical protein